MAGNYKSIEKKVAELVKKACFSSKNKYTATVWQYHILPVVKYADILARKLNADKEVAILSAYLHDYASLIDYNLSEEHHLHGAEIAGKILNRLGFDKKKTGHIKNCIYTHRGSLRLKPATVEARILASADAMSHITELADMFYLAYNVHGRSTAEGAGWLKKKFARSWQKIMPEGREMIREDYNIALKILNKAL